MIRLHRHVLLVYIIISCLRVQGADKYTDQNRPYEFGFSIDGEQHRHEKKDENGIIMGEFGFITADGVYHVTVYATDENGNFKILSMKNIRIKPYPFTSAATAVKTAGSGPEKGRSLSFSSNQNNQIPTTSTTTTTTPTTTTTTAQPKPKVDSIFSPVKSCSHCRLLTTTTTTTGKPDVKPSNPVYSANNEPNGNSFDSQLSGEQQSVVPGTSPLDSQNNNPKGNIGFNQNVPNPDSKNVNLGDQNSIKFSSNEQPSYQQNQQTFGDKQYNPVTNVNSQVSNTQNNAFENRFGVTNNYPKGNTGFNQNVPNPDSKKVNLGDQNSNKFSSNEQPNYQQNQQNLGDKQYNPVTNVNSQVSNTQNNAFENRFGSLSPKEPSVQNTYTNNEGQFGLSRESPLPAVQNKYDGINNAGLDDANVRTNAPGNNLQPPATQNIRNNLNSKTSSNNAANINRFDGNNGQNYPVKQEPISGERNPKQIGNVNLNPGQQYSVNEGITSKVQKPQLISAQMQIVPKSTDIYYKKPGEKDGLPDGLTTSDMENLLYTFNYTVGFHGHFEEGYTSGAKQGYYYVTGRNGVRTRVDYVADEHGFRPKITQEVLDLLSDDVPKPETEKEEKYGLKGYEFKWLYFPVGSKR